MLHEDKQFWVVIIILVVSFLCLFGQEALAWSLWDYEPVDRWELSVYTKGSQDQVYWEQFATETRCERERKAFLTGRFESYCVHNSNKR